ncbi:DUF4168 domain-containing protein [Synechocystis sp. LKSZ1]|uniref:DUF4168 domain-containing protein n=1 Tax=Synechocystis sp. LKSZ1 TaxID=3144951 RepID=UPI00336BE8F9
MFKMMLARGLAAILCLSLGFSVQPAWSQPAMTLAQATTVSPQELQQMARIIKQLQVIERDTQQKMTQAVQSAGLTPEQFMQIAEQKDASGKNTQSVSAADEAKFKQALPNVQKALIDSQGQQEAILQKEGLSVDKFNSTMEILVKNPQLQQEVQKLLDK